jgi:hypothetical protein
MFINFVSSDILPSLYFLKLPAGDCIFINLAYSNVSEASVPIKLKITVGDGEMQRRAYGKKHFGLVIDKLKKKVSHVEITSSSVTERIDALNSFILSEKHRQRKSNDETREILANINFLNSQAN